MQVIKRRLEVDIKKNWLRGVFLVLIWLLIVSMMRDFMQTRKGFDRIKETEARLVEVKRENQELLKKMSVVSSEEYREKLIREKLNMRLFDEVVVIMPRTESVDQKEEGVDKEVKNWEKWLKIAGY